MVLELTPKTVVFIFFNYFTYLINDQSYQSLVRETTWQFTTAFYNDLVSILWVHDFPAQSFMSVSDMAIQSGYAYEEYKVLTDDGYILTSYRLPGKIS